MTLILLIVKFTFAVPVLSREAGAVASLVCNVVILLSYPTNFFIYCAMSRAFRTTFAEMFCTGALARCRGSPDMRTTPDMRPRTTDAHMMLTTGKQCATNADRHRPMTTAAAAALRRCPDDDDNIDGNMTVALVDLCRDDDDASAADNLELVEERAGPSI